VRARHPGGANRQTAGATSAAPVRLAHWALAGFAVCALAAPIGVAPAYSADERVTLNFVNTDVDAVVRALQNADGGLR